MNKDKNGEDAISIISNLFFIGIVVLGVYYFYKHSLNELEQHKHFETPNAFLVEKDKISLDGLSNFEKGVLNLCLDIFYFEENNVKKVNIENISKCVDYNKDFIESTANSMFEVRQIYPLFVSFNSKFTDLFSSYLTKNHKNKDTKIAINEIKAKDYLKTCSFGPSCTGKPEKKRIRVLHS